MKRLLLSCTLCLFSFSVVAQHKTTEETKDKAYALLDLGFNAKLLHLASDGATIISPKEEVKKSPRSLEEILKKSKKEDKIEEVEVADLKYHLIAGCFSKLNNAENLIEELKAQGYPSEIVGKTNSDLYMVAYASFKTKREALNEMSQLTALGMSTWVRKQ